MPKLGSGFRPGFGQIKEAEHQKSALLREVLFLTPTQSSLEPKSAVDSMTCTNISQGLCQLLNSLAQVSRPSWVVDSALDLAK